MNTRKLLSLFLLAVMLAATQSVHAQGWEPKPAPLMTPWGETLTPATTWQEYPRPQLVRDMVFMSDEQRMRHTAKPGLSGLAQVNGRNAVSWEEKLDWDLKYIKRITFLGDLKIVFDTVKVALIKHEGITDGENATAFDYGDALLKEHKVTKEKYDALQTRARNIL